MKSFCLVDCCGDAGITKRPLILVGLCIGLAILAIAPALSLHLSVLALHNLHPTVLYINIPLSVA